MKGIKRLISVAVVLLIIATLIGCASPKSDTAAIEDTIKGCVDAYNARNYEKFVNYMTGLSEQYKAYMISQMPTSRAMGGEITLQKIENVVVSGSNATATMTVTSNSNNNEPDTSEVRLSKEHDIWKLDYGPTPLGPLTPPPIPTPVGTPSTSTPLPNTSSATSKSAHGLILSLSLNSTTFQPGQEVSVIIDEQNTLATVNNVSASNDWPLTGLTLGPCETLNYTFGVAIFQGNYTSSNVSSATPLQLYQPGGYHCPVILNINAYVFQPWSDIASVIGSCEPNPCFTDFIVSSEVTVTGYWSNNQEPVLGNFTPGVYTVVGGDEWGALAVLHFVVQ